MEPSHPTNGINGSEHKYIYIHNKTATLGIEREQMRNHAHYHRKHISYIKARMKQLCIEEYDSKEPQPGKRKGG